MRQAQAPHAARLVVGSGTEGGPTWRQPTTVHQHQHIAPGGSPSAHGEINTSHRIRDRDNGSAAVISSAAASEPPRKKRARRGPGAVGGQSDAAGGGRPTDPKTAGVASDPRVRDVGRMGSEERAWLLRRLGQARATALTMVYQDGSTQFDPEQVRASQGRGGGLDRRRRRRRRRRRQCGFSVTVF